MTNTLQEVRKAIEEKEEQLRDNWDAEEVDVHSHGLTLRWGNEVEETVENVHNMVDVMTEIAEGNPDAEVTGRADAGNYQVGLWHVDEDEEEGEQ